MRPLLLTALTAVLSMAQAPAAQEEAALRSAINGFLAAIRQSTGDNSNAYASKRIIVFSSGGATVGPRQLYQWRGGSRAALIRHVRLLTSDSAIAIGLWRDDKAAPDARSGIFDLSLVREDGTWKVASYRAGLMRSADSVTVAAVNGEIDSTGVVTAEERSAGWKAMFDGKTSLGWTSILGSKELPSAWRIADGCLITVPGVPPSDIRTVETYDAFEMSFEWKMPPKANSGVKYRIFGIESFREGVAAADGFEYQVADDNGDPGARVDAKQKSGALYGVTAVATSETKPVGEWNQSRLVVARDHIEHWLNGVKTTEYPVDVPFASPIVLQHHNSEVSFRNLKIRRL